MIKTEDVGGVAGSGIMTHKSDNVTSKHRVVTSNLLTTEVTTETLTSNIEFGDNGGDNGNANL